MKYIFLIMLIFTQVFTYGGARPSDKKTMKKEELKEGKKPIMQILPIKFSQKSDRFLEGQMMKMAMRHIALTGRYELTLGEINSELRKKLPIENLDIRLYQGKNYTLEMRIFELKRDVLKKKVQAKNIMRQNLLSTAEKLLGQLFFEPKKIKKL